jgi:Spy/CpxP family protein refolding chaperone
MRRASWSVALLVLVAGSSVAGAQSQPQEGQRIRRQRDGGGEGFRGMGRFGGMGGMMETPQVSRRDVEAMCEKLGLSDDQRESATALWEGYDQEVRLMRDEARAAREKAFESMRENGPEADAFQKMADEQATARAKRLQLDQALLTDMQSTLTPQQQPAWENAVRGMKRQQALRQGILSGEQADIGRLVDELKLADSERKELAPVLEQYELDLDRELTARDAVMGNAGFNPGALRDPDAREEMLDKLEQRRSASEKVRDVNDRYSRQVSSLLPESRRSEFDNAYKHAKFPQVYRRSSTGEALDAAAQFDDLTSEQRDSVNALTERYQTRLGEINPRYEKAFVEVEKNFNIRQMFTRGEGEPGGGPNPIEPVRSAREERQELDESTARELRTILTPEQAERLPEPEQREIRRGRGRRGGPGMPDGF